MLLDVARARKHLKAFDFKTLFIEELGWDHYANPLSVMVDGQTFVLSPVAQKRGFVVAVCNPLADGCIPEYALRCKIERQVARSVHEHLIIYVDQGKTTQTWQWVKREIGKPIARREHTYHHGQPGDSLIQRLEALAFSFEEEEGLTIVDVIAGVVAGFDVERVTRRFYDRFKTEHAAFSKFLKGIPSEDMQRWYVSVMLNRLMFIYFVQKKGFLDGDLDYMRNKLAASQERGKDRFYREFLCPLFFEGFAQQERSAATSQLLGRVPYLDGGLFLRHQIEEQCGKAIQIPDAAFERLFKFFDAYRWHLDERPLRKDNEINPDVLGYIFEKYINQKQMGAYYTKEDITGYISQETVIPYLFDVACQKCKSAFEGEQSVWRLLQADPDRYIYPAVKHGVTLPLPKEIAAGLGDVSKRTEWNRPAPPEYALPTEIWREAAARRKRYEDVRARLANGEVREINDLITYNLDIRQFAQDVIENSEGPELVRAFWHAIESITMLDPTVGSGAFLFAALNILEPLYEACLERMQVFLSDLERSDEKHRPEKYADFRKVLERMTQHPNRRYFVLKSIIVNNLFGVDIMEEAVEICKLRLFLKLVAQVEDADKIEPLPDIDFNIRAGNTLVGFATREQVRLAITTAQSGQMKLLSTDDLDTFKRIDESAEIADRAFAQFHQMQTRQGMQPADFAQAKHELRHRLNTLNDELNRYLAGEYGVDAGKKTAYNKWLESHRPFHWFVEFYGILNRGGFDVIIGNPPYVEYPKVRGQYQVHGYETEECGNLYAFVMERSFRLLNKNSRIGMIVPIGLITVSDTVKARSLLRKQLPVSWISSFAIRPAKLFEGVEQRLSVVVGAVYSERETHLFTTKYNQWYRDERPALFPKLEYCDAVDLASEAYIPKVGNSTALSVLRKINSMNDFGIGKTLVKHSDARLIFHRTPGYWIRVMDFEPYFKSPTNDRSIHHIRELFITNKPTAQFAGSVISSSMYFFWFFACGNCRNLTLEDVKLFRIGEPSPAIAQKASKLFGDLMVDFKRNSVIKTRGVTEFQEFDWGVSKPIIDEIDRVLAHHYGFTSEELDFIINYDIKIRMGRGAGEEDEE